MALKVKKGDRVVVLSGKDKGKEGVILESRPSVGKVVVEGVNQVKKHVKPSAQDAKGGIKTIEAPIHASNVMLVGKDGKVVRTARRPDASGKRIRVAKATGAAV
jgi:large subunit ribosomal protein L24